MTKQLLIYERATPINPNDHRDVSVKFGGDFGFARDVNSVPLMAAEFENASVEYPIVFVGDASGVMPAALLGIRDNENLYVEENGAWNAKYVPAFVRRYPFVFSTDDNQRFTLCIDEDFHGVNRKGQGERLFDADGADDPVSSERAQLLAGLPGAVRDDARLRASASRTSDC